MKRNNNQLHEYSLQHPLYNDLPSGNQQQPQQAKRQLVDSTTSAPMSPSPSRSSSISNTYPPRYIPNDQAAVIPIPTLQQLEDIKIDLFDNNSPSKFTFIFFLGVQGKEHIPFIQSLFPENISTAFISGNISQCTNAQCISLSQYFHIMDPIGGGLYPLDYLYIISDNKINCKIPIIINHQNRFLRSISTNKNKSGISSHLNFGIELNELQVFINNYLEYH
ncbi:uncharacterized protein J8A68_001448 [[Candida] subhashii]|uniref:Uncharacterized protein n=1 Tax=[Candida] subhashii TaxID=561895 RepID=A0A8J5QR19_9ASCO|nr:uncharacterized protein J8A68_001448 [[Candida] subhashii]KAG7665040.1 hypothetical protein J8A68_001448 [[Candida] subhashii]